MVPKPVLQEGAQVSPKVMSQQLWGTGARERPSINFNDVLLSEAPCDVDVDADADADVDADANADVDADVDQRPCRRMGKT